MGAVDLKHGTFAWTDLMTVDPEGAKTFYGDLFGWGHEEIPTHPGHSYTLFTHGPELVSGMAEMAPEMKEEDVPLSWASYILVDDVDVVTARVPDLGGSVFMPPVAVMDSGRMSIVLDPSGGRVSFWEAGTHSGASTFNEPGAMAWNELLTRDPEAARAFFTELLGWGWQEMDLGENGTYHVGMVDDRPNGGIMGMPDTVPDHVPPHWDVHFAVADVDDASARVRTLGGTVVVPPTDISVGRFSSVSDPSGAHFSLFMAAPAQPAS